MDLMIQNLRKHFANRSAVDIPALTISSGEFFTLVGPSGCGKSTTLNIIAGLEEPSEGTVRHGDTLLNGLPPHRRDIAFVFQSYALYPHRTVARNLSFPLELAGIDRAAIRARVAETAELLGLTPLLEKLPRQLSGGERQRVALGRAIIRKPKLFLLDEPLSNLDAVLRAQMRRELKRLHDRLKTTFIYVTHDQEEALSLSDRVAILRDGRIQQCATPREIYERPVNRFVAGFFGSPPMNFLAARVARKGDLFFAAAGGLCVVLPASVTPWPDELTLGVRPEHVRLHREPRPDSSAMEVALVEPHGGQVQIELQVGGQRLLAVVGADADWQPGQTLHVEIPRDRLYAFSASGERISSAG